MTDYHKAMLELDTGDLTRLSNRSSYPNSEIKEIFNQGSREEKLEFLSDASGKSATIVAPSSGVPYNSDLEGAKQLNLIIEGEINADTDLMAVPEGDISRGGSYWAVVTSNTFMRYFREVGSDTYETLQEETMMYDGRLFQDVSYNYSHEFQESYSLSNNEGNKVICPKPADLETRGYLILEFQYLESAVRVSREGGGFRGSWFKDKTVEWNDEKRIAKIEVDDGFIIIDYNSLVEREEYTDKKLRLGDFVRKHTTDEGEMPMVTVLETSEFTKNDLIDESTSGSLEVTENDLRRKINEELDAYDSKSYGNKLTVDEEITEEVADTLLELSPEPVEVTDKMVQAIKGENPDFDYVKVRFKESQDRFTGSDLEVYSDLDAGDIATIPKVDRANVARNKSEEMVLDELEKRTDGYEWKKLDKDFHFTVERDDYSFEVIYDPSQEYEYVAIGGVISEIDDIDSTDKFGLLSKIEYNGEPALNFSSFRVDKFMNSIASLNRSDVDQSVRDYILNVFSSKGKRDREELVEIVTDMDNVSRSDVEQEIDKLLEEDVISETKSAVDEDYIIDPTKVDTNYELNDSESKIDKVYERYNDLVNMTPSDIEGRLDRDKCLNRASGSDAEEHLKRNKFIQETNKSEWGSKKVPESFANSSAESRRVVDQAVRTISFGERHLAQLRNEDIVREEDGCFNPRVEGLKNWAINPLEMSEFSVDEDKSSEMSDVSYSVKSSGLGQETFSDHKKDVSTMENGSGSESIESFSDAENHFMGMDFDSDSEEFFVATYLSGDRSVLGSEVVAEGDIDSVDFDNSDIVGSAEGLGAEGVIISHNHPSGNPEPSEKDLSATRGLKSDLERAGIDLVDHIVLADGEARSMKGSSKLF